MLRYSLSIICGPISTRSPVSAWVQLRARPPSKEARSTTRGLKPRSHRATAQARPAIPPPMTMLSACIPLTMGALEHACYACATRGRCHLLQLGADALEELLHAFGIQMATPRPAVVAAAIQAARGENELPAPFPLSATVASRLGGRQAGVSQTLREIVGMQGSHLVEVGLQRCHQPLRQFDFAQPLTLLVANDQLATEEVHIPDPQLHRLVKAQRGRHQ